jgi:hypothetical protein
VAGGRRDHRANPVLLCRRRGAAIDLVLDRPRQARSQFVFTQAKGREAIFWQTQKTARAANPGGRIPRRRSLTNRVTITVDTRERYPYRFARQGAATVRETVSAGDYAVHAPEGTLVGAVERKSLENLASTLSDGTLAFQLQRLTELPVAAIVVEAHYGALFKLEHVNGNWLADQPASTSATPKSRSPSPAAAPTQKTGPTDSSPPRSPTATPTTPPSETPPCRKNRGPSVRARRLNIFDPYTSGDASKPAGRSPSFALPSL